jgi:mono/diheme cytochrome c family protein
MSAARKNFSPTIFSGTDEPLEMNTRMKFFGTFAARAARAFALGAGVLSSFSADAKEVTFTRDIAPIVFQNCSGCHRPGEVAPFALLGYEDVRKRAKTIERVVGDRYMPPWKADPAIGEFHDVRRLSDAQIAAIREWVAAGTPEGRAEDLPPAPKFTSAWPLGEPDLILTPAKEFSLGAEGRDAYRSFVIPGDFKTDRYISAVDFRPGNRRVVHHMIAFTDATGTARQLEAASKDGPGFSGQGFKGAEWLDGWAPGRIARHLPPRYGKRIPAGADIVLQMHYHKSGKPEKDRSQVALYFAKGDVDRQVFVSRVTSRGLQIPAGESDYVARGSLPVPWNAIVLEVFPHMHLIGREMTVTATLPDQREIGMIRVPDWDFNWQTSYAYKQPLLLPRGSRIDMVAHFDNSDKNPRNPNHPPKLVRWGEQTTDEMCMAFISFATDAPAAGTRVAKIWDSMKPAERADLLRRFDKNHDGKLDDAERTAAIQYLLKQRGGEK